MSKVSRLYLAEDDKGNVINEIQWPGENQSFDRILEINTETTLSVPEWATKVSCVVQPGGAVKIGYGPDALTLPSVGVWQSQRAEHNPILRSLFDPNGNKIDTLRLISITDQTSVNVIFYAKDESDQRL